MNVQGALVIVILIFILFLFISYYGAKLTICSSIVFTTFISLILLIAIYPPNKIVDQQADFSLILYGVFIILALIIVALYVFYYTLTDVRLNICM